MDILNQFFDNFKKEVQSIPKAKIGRVDSINEKEKVANIQPLPSSENSLVLDVPFVYYTDKKGKEFDTLKAGDLVLLVYIDNDISLIMKSQDRLNSVIKHSEEDCIAIPLKNTLDLLECNCEALGSSKEDIEHLINKINEINKQVLNKAEKTEIPKNISQLNNDKNYITLGEIPEVDLSGLKDNIEQLQESKADIDKVRNKLTTIQQEIPKNISQLNNDKNYITLGEVPEVDLAYLEKDLEQLKTDKADKKDIPKNISQLNNDKNYITLGEVPKIDLSPYLKKDGTDSEVTLGKGYQFETNFKNDNWSFINNYTGGGWARGLLNIKDKEGNNYFQIGGNGGGQNFTRLYMGKAWNDWNLSINPNTNTVDIIGKLKINNQEIALNKEIPKNISQLNNDKNYITIEQVPKTDLTSIEKGLESLEINKAEKTEIPKNISQLNNDKNYITLEQVPKTDLTNINNSLASLSINKADRKDIPKNISQLNNDRNYITLEQVPKVDLTDIKKDINKLDKEKANASHNHSDYVKKSGDTMAGTLSVKTPHFPVARFERETTATGNRYGAINLVRSGASPVDGIGIGFYFKNNNSNKAETHSGFFGGALDKVKAGEEVGQLVFAPSYRGQDPYARTDFTLTALNSSESEANFKGMLKVNNNLVALEKDIPKNISQLNNDKKYITLEQVPKVDLTNINNSLASLNINKADKKEIPKNISQLNNDKNYANIEDINRLDAKIKALDIPEGVDLTPVYEELEKLKADIKAIRNQLASGFTWGDVRRK